MRLINTNPTRTTNSALYRRALSILLTPHRKTWDTERGLLLQSLFIAWCVKYKAWTKHVLNMISGAAANSCGGLFTAIYNIIGNNKQQGRVKKRALNFVFVNLIFSCFYRIGLRTYPRALPYPPKWTFPYRKDVRCLISQFSIRGRFGPQTQWSLLSLLWNVIKTYHR